MNKLILSVYLLLFAASCDLVTKPEQPIPDGGDCSYKTTNIPATIIEIYRADSTHSELILVASHENNPADTLYYSNFFGGYIHNDSLTKYNYKKGDRLTYKYKQIIEGSCTPDIYVLTTEPFVEK